MAGRKRYVVAKLLVLATAAMLVLFLLHLAIRQETLTSRLNGITSQASQDLDPINDADSGTGFLNFRRVDALIGLLRQIASALNTTNRIFTVKVNMMTNDASAKQMQTGSDVISGSPTIGKTSFKPVLADDEKRILLDLLTKVASVCAENNVTYSMYGGTLLGSYRHHDVIPWDDDVDVIVNKTDRERLLNALQTLKPEYEVYPAGPRLKFNSVKSSKQSKFKWKWPYIDIHFFKENSTHIWDGAKEFRNYIYKKSIIFPLHQRPLAGIYLNAPRDTFAYLKATYTNTKCETHYYSHKYETNRGMRRVSVTCESLKDHIPFVHRSPDHNGVRETLMLGNAMLHSIVVPEPKYAITKPYNLQLV